jgi:hypothetical protein
VLYLDACAARDYKLNAARIAYREAASDAELALERARATIAKPDADIMDAAHAGMIAHTANVTLTAARTTFVAVQDAVAKESAKLKRYSDSAQAHYALMQEVGMMLLRDDLNNPRIEELWLQGQSSGK